MSNRNFALLMAALTLALVLFLAVRSRAGGVEDWIRAMCSYSSPLRSDFVPEWKDWENRYLVCGDESYH